MKATQQDRTIAFIVTPKVREYTRALSQAVRDVAILPVIGGSGAGKDRLIDWWWQEGLKSEGGPGLVPLSQEEIIVVDAAPSPAPGIPVTCGLFMQLWRALEEMERAWQQGEPPRRLGRTRRCTESEVVSAFYDNVVLLADELEPAAFVITNAQHLDKRAVELLLQLRTPVRRHQPRIARRAIILCAQVEAGSVESSKFSKLMNSIGETRAAWPNKLEIAPMTGVEVADVIMRLLKRNLGADVGSDLDQRAVLVDFGEWTLANWWLMAALVKVIDQELGPQRGDQPRVLTKAVYERVKERWLRRMPSLAPAEEQS